MAPEADSTTTEVSPLSLLQQVEKELDEATFQAALGNFEKIEAHLKTAGERSNAYYYEQGERSEALTTCVNWTYRIHEIQRDACLKSQEPAPPRPSLEIEEQKSPSDLFNEFSREISEALFYGRARDLEKMEALLDSALTKILALSRVGGEEYLSTCLHYKDEVEKVRNQIYIAELGRRHTVGEKSQFALYAARKLAESGNKTYQQFFSQYAVDCVVAAARESSLMGSVGVNFSL